MFAYNNSTSFFCGDEYMCKLYNDPIHIKSINGHSYFIWRDKTYKILKTLKKWTVKKHWWNEKRAVDRVYATVEAQFAISIGVYELYYCNLTRAFFLSKVLD